ncbi:division plane positioning ATPase MipZ [Sphingomonas sp.]|uniref:division plane positioning ATPase MipZ n=1 Tax=Sphingomonas sp. TaxID=28214 RepID=UPI003B3B69F1
MVAHRIIFANEKGGSGKSTSAVHTAVALAVKGHKVAALDLDTRQRTLGRYLDNRAALANRDGLDLPIPTFDTFDPDKGIPIGERMDALAAEADYLIVDTPGRDDDHVRAAIASADTLVTPINDSFVDLDLIGQVDPDSYKIKRPSYYAELVWDARKLRARQDGGTVDWVVLRNRLQHLEARNMRRVAAALGELSKRVGFRVIPGLSERVIYRELFPKGLTLLDLAAIGKEAGLGHVAARGELRELIAGLQLPETAAASAREAEPA